MDRYRSAGQALGVLVSLGWPAMCGSGVPTGTLPTRVSTPDHLKRERIVWSAEAVGAIRSRDSDLPTEDRRNRAGVRRFSGSGWS